MTASPTFSPNPSLVNSPAAHGKPSFGGSPASVVGGATPGAFASELAQQRLGGQEQRPAQASSPRPGPEKAGQEATRAQAKAQDKAQAQARTQAQAEARAQAQRKPTAEEPSDAPSEATRPQDEAAAEDSVQDLLSRLALTDQAPSPADGSASAWQAPAGRPPGEAAARSAAQGDALADEALGQGLAASAGSADPAGLGRLAGLAGLQAGRQATPGGAAPAAADPGQAGDRTRVDTSADATPQVPSTGPGSNKAVPGSAAPAAADPGQASDRTRVDTSADAAPQVPSTGPGSNKAVPGSAALAAASQARASNHVRADASVDAAPQATAQDAADSTTALQAAAAAAAQAPGTGPASDKAVPDGGHAHSAAAAMQAGQVGQVPLGAGASAGAAPPLPEARLPAPPGHADFAPQLGAQISLFVRQGVQQARLQLNPAEMGPITVQIRLDGGAAQVQLMADNALTRQALEQAMPSLAGSLRESGLTLTGGGVFESPQQNSPGTPGHPGDQAHTGGGHAQGTRGGSQDRADQPLTGPLVQDPGLNPAPGLNSRRGVVDLVA